MPRGGKNPIVGEWYRLRSSAYPRVSKQGASQVEKEDPGGPNLCSLLFKQRSKPVSKRAVDEQEYRVQYALT